MRKYLLVISLLLISISAQASKIFGDWQGVGIAVNSEGSVNCENISVSINAVTNDSISINKISWKCGSLNFTSKKQILSIIDGQLYYKGNESPIGTIDNSSLSLDVTDAGLSYSVVLIISEGQLAFIKRITSNKNNQSMAVGGSLSSEN